MTRGGRDFQAQGRIVALSPHEDLPVLCSHRAWGEGEGQATDRYDAQGRGEGEGQETDRYDAAAGAAAPIHAKCTFACADAAP